MGFCRATQRLGAVCVTSAVALVVAHAADSSLGIVGKNEWLFYRYETLHPFEAAATSTSIDLIARLNRILSASGTSLVVVPVPLKMRVYAEYLPDDIKINAYMAEHYEHAMREFQAREVDGIDLNGPFLNDAKRNSELPLFFKRDTHWTPAGALLAGEIIKRGIRRSPRLSAALDATTEVDYKIAIGNLGRPFKGGDLIGQIPKKSPPAPPEQVRPVSVVRVAPESEGLGTSRPSVGVALVGSTYSYAWTGFQDALRFALQRDVIGSPYGPGEGPWVGLENYIRSAHFQSNKARVLIWEIPERELRGPPNYRFRDARSMTDSEEWLSRVAVLAQRRCHRSDTVAKIQRAGLAAKDVGPTLSEVTAPTAKEGDYIQIGLDGPLDALDYLSVRYVTTSAKAIAVEISAAGMPANRMLVTPVGGDGDYVLKVPLSSAARGGTQIRIFPGNSDGFKLQNPEICRLPAALRP